MRGHAAVGVAGLLFDAVGFGVQRLFLGFVRGGGGLSFQGVGLLFRTRFERKGRFKEYMQAIPTKVILHKQAALLGAARVAFNEAG